jgi:hypothetical protein
MGAISLENNHLPMRSFEVKHRHVYVTLLQAVSYIFILFFISLICKTGENK